MPLMTCMAQHIRRHPVQQQPSRLGMSTLCCKLAASTGQIRRQSCSAWPSEVHMLRDGIKCRILWLWMTEVLGRREHWWPHI